MKKFYILVAFLIFTGFIFAQSTFKQQRQKSGKTLSIDSSILKRINTCRLNSGKKENKSGVSQDWFNYADLWEDSLYGAGSTTGLGGMYFFPDTLVKAKFLVSLPNKYEYIGTPFQGLSILLDPTAPIFNKKLVAPLNPSLYYSVDSVSFFSTYFRKINSIDTLIIEVITGWQGPVDYFDNVHYPLISTDFAVDTLWYGPLNFLSPPNFSNPPAIDYRFNLAYYDSLYTANKWHKLHYYQYKKLLTDSDTIQFPLNWITIVPNTKPDTGKIILTFQFKPGYPYVEGDTFTSYKDKNKNHKNSMLFWSFMENKLTSQLPKYNRYDWNCSYTIPTSSTIDDPNINQGWYNTYVPEWDWMLGGFPYDNHWIRTKLVYNMGAGITENQSKSIMLSQNIPNPADNSTLINYQLHKTNNISLVVTDMTGRVIMNVNQGRQIAGSHSITLNTAKLANGMYYYTLNADNTKLTRKMIIVR